MNKIYSLILFCLCTFFIYPCFADGNVGKDCTYKGIKLSGKVQVVENFPDIKVQIVDNFPDLKVKRVDNFPDNCGEWKYVQNFPDFKIQFVTSFPDIKIKFVDNFPGL